MAWTAPRTWLAYEMATATKLNADLRNNFKYLKGTDGPVEHNAQLRLASDAKVTLSLGTDVHSVYGTLGGSPLDNALTLYRAGANDYELRIWQGGTAYEAIHSGNTTAQDHQHWFNEGAYDGSDSSSQYLTIDDSGAWSKTSNWWAVNASTGTKKYMFIGFFTIKYDINDSGIQVRLTNSTSTFSSEISHLDGMAAPSGDYCYRTLMVTWYVPDVRSTGPTTVYVEAKKDANSPAGDSAVYDYSGLTGNPHNTCGLLIFNFDGLPS